ncbi:hypothetical protein [Limosilactobacillus urinaemulieris]|uniref:hypothetical protein n=1 Tax=Limosilactobacillus urinaemulieris TaxID=2742600 RepID=UPI001F56716F|nr:hypothetical protein [Limosilactobacillus urinaemulieris]
MERNLQEIINSSKRIMENSKNELARIDNDPHPNKELRRVIEGNYNTAKQTLEIADSITSHPVVSSVSKPSSHQPAVKDSNQEEHVKVTFTSTKPDDENKSMTRAEYRKSLKKNK